MGNDPAAKPMYQQDIEVSEKALTLDHTQTKMLKANFAKMQADRDKG